MVRPLTWDTPASGATIGTSTPYTQRVFHSGNYWFALSAIENPSTTFTLRYATDPSGSWSTATLPSPPSPFTDMQTVAWSGDCIAFDGSTYAMLARYTQGATFTWRVLTASDPSGTWSQYQFDASDKCEAHGFSYIDDRFAATGYYGLGGGVDSPAFIAYTGAGSAANTAYTIGTADADHGYAFADIVPLSGGSWDIVDFIKFNGTYITVGQQGGTGSSASEHVRYATSWPGGTWGTPTAGTVGIRVGVNTWPLLSANGYLMYDINGSTKYVTTDPVSGSWSSFGTAQTGLNFNSRGQDVAYAPGAWVISGARNLGGTVSPIDPAIAYLEAGGPSGTYTLVPNTTFTDQSGSSEIASIAYHDGYLVAISEYFGELRYCRVPTRKTTLRQRQSPVRTPSRVRGVNLRARQTTFIT